MTSDPGDVSARTRVFGLVGHPVRHSLSPDMYNTLFRRYGLEAVYVCFDVDPRQARGVSDAVRTLGLAGVNLTVPFKETCLPYLDSLTKAAQEAGAVNVVTHVDGALQGYNTDGEGLMRSLEDDAGLSLGGGGGPLGVEDAVGHGARATGPGAPGGRQASARERETTNSAPPLAV